MFKDNTTLYNIQHMKEVMMVKKVTSIIGTDTGPGMNHRKVSMSVCLSDPKEYTGGDI